MEGFLELFKVDANGNITLEVPAGDGQIGAIDTYDIGESSAELFASGNPLNGHALITGTENVSMQRVAKAFSAAAGSQITYVDANPDSYRAEL
jgi:uncharacterized protein YbjT (DUF2867 family)